MACVGAECRIHCSSVCLAASSGACDRGVLFLPLTFADDDHTTVDHQVERILVGLRGEQFRHPALVEQAMGRQALAHLRTLDGAAADTVELEHALLRPSTSFPTHQS